MLDIIFVADRDAYKLRDADLIQVEIKQIAKQNAWKKYPSCTRFERGLYRAAFIQKVQEHQYNAWIDELNSDFRGGI